MVLFTPQYYSVATLPYLRPFFCTVLYVSHDVSHDVSLSHDVSHAKIINNQLYRELLKQLSSTYMYIFFQFFEFC